MKDEWLEDPLGGYEENARHLFGYPESTLREYLRDLNQFEDWICDSESRASTRKESTTGSSTRLGFG